MPFVDNPSSYALSQRASINSRNAYPFVNANNQAEMMKLMMWKKAISDFTDKQEEKREARKAASSGGRGTGAAIGAVAGTIIAPGVGTAIGSKIGGSIGGAVKPAGGPAGEAKAQSIQDAFNMASPFVGGAAAGFENMKGFPHEGIPPGGMDAFREGFSGTMADQSAQWGPLMQAMQDGKTWEGLGNFTMMPEKKGVAANKGGGEQTTSMGQPNPAGYAAALSAGGGGGPNASPPRMDPYQYYMALMKMFENMGGIPGGGNAPTTAPPMGSMNSMIPLGE